MFFENFENAFFFFVPSLALNNNAKNYSVMAIGRLLKAKFQRHGQSHPSHLCKAESATQETTGTVRYLPLYLKLPFLIFTSHLSVFYRCSNK